MKTRERFGIEEHGATHPPMFQIGINPGTTAAVQEARPASADHRILHLSQTQSQLIPRGPFEYAAQQSQQLHERKPRCQDQNHQMQVVHSFIQYLKKFYFHIGPCFNVSAWLQGEKQGETLQWSDFTGKRHWPPGQSSTLIPQGKASLRAIFHLGCPWPI